MTTLREAAQMALKALDSCSGEETYDGEWVDYYDQDLVRDAKEALRQALAQPEQEQYVTKVVAVHEDGTYTTERIPLPKREWVGLTWDEIDYCFESCVVRKFSQDGKEEGCVNTHEVAKAIEVTLKEKNAC